jgi:hypothetical protein
MIANTAMQYFLMDSNFVTINMDLTGMIYLYAEFGEIDDDCN